MMKVIPKGWSWWHKPIIPVLGRWRPDDQEFKVMLICVGFKARLDYIRHCFKRNKIKGN